MGFKYNRTNNQNESDNNTYEDNETEYFDYFDFENHYMFVSEWSLLAQMRDIEICQ